MDRIRQLLNSIQAQLGGLSVSQRIAIGLCAALIAGSVVWLLQWSTAPEMVSVLSHDFTLEELNAADEALRGSGLTYRVQGTRILVRAADRYDALRVLHAGNALPEGSLFDMAKMVGEENPFQSPEARDYAQNYAKGNELAKIIATYAGVRSAAVLINPISKRRLGGGNDVPTASVTVTLMPGREMNFEMVEAFARLISGAVAGLKPYNVNVVDGRSIQSYTVPKPEDAGNFEHFRMVQKLEERLLSKVRARLADIPGVLASVTVELDTSKRVKQTHLHDAPQPKTETSQSSEHGGGDPANEPGVQANVGQAVTSAGASSKQTTEESMVENFEPKLRETETVELGPSIKKVTAGVGVPRSFIAGVFRARYPESAEPKDDDPQFQAVQAEQLARVKGSVERIVMAKSPADVQVDVYPDLEWNGAGPSWSAGATAAKTAAGSFDLIETIRGYGPQAGLGLLALFSLWMMIRIARRTAELVPAGLTGEQELGGAAVPEAVLTTGSFPVGQATATDGFLVGKEVDDEVLRYRELTGEVTKLVGDDPEGAADMIRRWMEGD